MKAFWWYIERGEKALKGKGRVMATSVESSPSSFPLSSDLGVDREGSSPSLFPLREGNSPAIVPPSEEPPRTAVDPSSLSTPPPLALHPVKPETSLPSLSSRPSSSVAPPTAVTTTKAVVPVPRIPCVGPTLALPPAPDEVVVHVVGREEEEEGSEMMQSEHSEAAEDLESLLHASNLDTSLPLFGEEEEERERSRDSLVDREAASSSSSRVPLVVGASSVVSQRRLCGRAKLSSIRDGVTLASPEASEPHLSVQHHDRPAEQLHTNAMRSTNPTNSSPSPVREKGSQKGRRRMEHGEQSLLSGVDAPFTLTTFTASGSHWEEKRESRRKEKPWKRPPRHCLFSEEVEEDDADPHKIEDEAEAEVGEEVKGEVETGGSSPWNTPRALNAKRTAATMNPTSLESFGKGKRLSTPFLWSPGFIPGAVAPSPFAPSTRSPFSALLRMTEASTFLHPCVTSSSSPSCRVIPSTPQTS